MNEKQLKHQLWDKVFIEQLLLVSLYLYQFKTFVGLSSSIFFVNHIQR